MVAWSQKGFADALQRSADFEESARESFENPASSPRASTVTTPMLATPSADFMGDLNGNADDPNQLEKAKQRKTALLEAIRQFSLKPKRGIAILVSQGFIKSNSPEHIAGFLFKYNHMLDKKMIGVYLGDGDAGNVATMHAFVDLMDFSRMRFVDALRRFLQSFRLPGEAQQIDRFMLKFAERYISGNPNAFANADTAYILAYSVILLNTDQHNEMLRADKRMTKEEFVTNNRGINDNADLPEDYLNSIYDEIRSNEIVLIGEKGGAKLLGAQSSSGIVDSLGKVIEIGRAHV